VQRDDEVRLTLPLTPSARRLAAAVAADLGRQLGAEVPPAVGAALDRVWSAVPGDGSGATVVLTYRVDGARLAVESEVLP
jgi:hypothetical protein